MEMKNSNIPTVQNNLNQQVDSYLKIFNLSMDMVQKLTQNNIEYSKNLMSNSLHQIQPLSNRANVTEPIQLALSKTMENHRKLCQQAHAIITDTTHKIKSEYEKQHHTPLTPFNFFNAWGSQASSVEQIYKNLSQPNDDEIRRG